MSRLQLLKMDGVSLTKCRYVCIFIFSCKLYVVIQGQKSSEITDRILSWNDWLKLLSFCAMSWFLKLTRVCWSFIHSKALKYILQSQFEVSFQKGQVNLLLFILSTKSVKGFDVEWRPHILVWRCY